MPSRQERLLRKFRAQAAFAQDYSPLYARLFGTIAKWLAAPGAASDELVAWLLEAARDRSSLDVTLLLAAGLHRAVLVKDPAAARLARYYPSVNGTENPQSPAFEADLRLTITALQGSLARTLHHEKVQTNETGRGLCWLLPATTVTWPEIHLVDLGASAGLNLAADHRSYRLLGAPHGELAVDLGIAPPGQFMVHCSGNWQPVASMPDELPRIMSRTGCDLAPFPLLDHADELALMSFIWADQPHRLARLREGIDAFQAIQKTASAVHLYPVLLPDELATFLRDSVPGQPDEPVVIYNTWVTSYLKDKGSSLLSQLGRWAKDQRRSLLWVQWEPPRDASQPSADGWAAWTADLWQAGVHHHWQLGWAHAHGGEVEFGPGLTDWLAYWS